MTISTSAMTSLQMLAETGSGYLTAQQGSELMTSGLITVDASKSSPVDQNAFLCTLTEAGMTLLTTPAPAPAPTFGFPPAPAPAPAFAMPVNPAPFTSQDVYAPPVTSSDIVIESGVAVPEIKRGMHLPKREKGPEKYPFSQLQIGQSFHVPPGADIDKTARLLSTAASIANSESKVPVDPAHYVTVTKKRVRKDENGNNLVNDKGVKLFETYQEQELKTVQTKFFVSRKVGKDDPKGPGVRVFRVAEAI